MPDGKPNIDRIANEGMRFTGSSEEQSCTAGRAAFIGGQSVYRTGMSKVGIPSSGQFGKNHFGDLRASD
jgi:arylsulfatase A-like enzyme